MKLQHFFSSLCILFLLGACSSDDNGAAPITPEESNAPPVVADQTFSVFEDITDADTIAQLVATDADGTALVFDIINDPSELFTVTPGGILRLVNGASLDFEQAQTHTLTINVSDGVENINFTVTLEVQNIIENLFEDPGSFIITLNVEDAASKVTIPTVEGLDYKYSLDWGDGSPEVDFGDGTSPTHEYANAAQYQVAIKGDFPAIRMGDLGEKDAGRLVSLDQWGTTVWETLEEAFAGAENMVYAAEDIPNLEEVNSMQKTFYNARAFNGNLNAWDVSQVKDMTATFQNAEVFNGNLSEWNVGNVVSMKDMFNGAAAFEGGDLSQWMVDNVTDMSAMFKDAVLFNSDISGWEVGKVIDFEGTFLNAEAFDQSLAEWNVFAAASFNQMLTMLSDSGLSTESYSATLVGWSQLDAIDLGVDFAPTGLVYCGDEAKTALTVLEGKGWTIIGHSECSN